MVVIISGPGDKSANNIMEWLNHLSCKNIRVDLGEEDYKQICISYQNRNCAISMRLKNGELLDFNDVSFFIYRGSTFQGILNR